LMRRLSFKKRYYLAERGRLTGWHIGTSLAWTRFDFFFANSGG
jgi:hypothetical protein